MSECAVQQDRLSAKERLTRDSRKRRQIEPDAFISVSFEMSGSTSLLHVCNEEPDGCKHLGLKLTVVKERTQQLFDVSSLLSSRLQKFPKLPFSGKPWREFPDIKHKQQPRGGTFITQVDLVLMNEGVIRIKGNKWTSVKSCFRCYF